MRESYAGKKRDDERKFPNADGTLVPFGKLSAIAQREVLRREQMPKRIAQCLAYGISQHDAARIANFDRTLAELCGELDSGRSAGTPPRDMALLLGLSDPRTGARVPIAPWNGREFTTHFREFGAPRAGNRGAYWREHGLTVTQARYAAARMASLCADERAVSVTVTPHREDELAEESIGYARRMGT